jgi:hypothetical protein
VPNGVELILGVIGGLPTATFAAFEAAFDWGWPVGLQEDYSFDPHLVDPLQRKAIASARLENDRVDAAILAQLLRADLLPEAWIGPADHRAQLVRLRTLLRHRIQAVLTDYGHDRPAGCWSGRAAPIPIPHMPDHDCSDQHSPDRNYIGHPEDVQACPSNPSHTPTVRVTGGALIRLPDVGER